MVEPWQKWALESQPTTIWLFLPRADLGLRLVHFQLEQPPRKLGASYAADQWNTPNCKRSVLASVLAEVQLFLESESADGGGSRQDLHCKLVHCHRVRTNSIIQLRHHLTARDRV